MQPDESFLLPDSVYVQRCRAISISLTPRLSLHYNRFSGLLVDLQKTADAVGVRSDVINTQLKQGVNETVSRR